MSTIVTAATNWDSCHFFLYQIRFLAFSKSMHHLQRKYSYSFNPHQTFSPFSSKARIKFCIHNRSSTDFTNIMQGLSFSRMRWPTIPWINSRREKFFREHNLAAAMTLCKGAPSGIMRSEGFGPQNRHWHRHTTKTRPPLTGSTD
jgi:hypothetical protein